MKAGDIIATSGNLFIQFATISKWSHVAFAVDSSRVIEMIPSGVIVRSLDECISNTKSYAIFSRPTELGDNEKTMLTHKIKELTEKKPKYGWLRAGYSGLPHIIRNAFIMIASLTYTGSIATYFILDNITLSYPLLLISSIALFIGYPITKIMGNAQRTNKILETINAPDYLKTNLDHRYCSQLVDELDRSINGNLHKCLSMESELRPKDIVKACALLGWNNINTQSTKPC